MTGTNGGGMELDAMVAEKVMGWVPLHGAMIPESVTPERLGERGHFKKVWMETNIRRACEECGDLPMFSTDIADAFQVVEKLTSTTKQWFRCEQSCITWQATFSVSGDGDNDFEATAEGDSMPEAICRAALAACKEKP